MALLLSRAAVLILIPLSAFCLILGLCSLFDSFRKRSSPASFGCSLVVALIPCADDCALLYEFCGYLELCSQSAAMACPLTRSELLGDPLDLTRFNDACPNAPPNPIACNLTLGAHPGKKSTQIHANLSLTLACGLLFCNNL